MLFRIALRVVLVLELSATVVVAAPVTEAILESSSSSSTSSNSRLYVADADGTVSTLALNSTGGGLSIASTIVACGNDPSWLNLSPDLVYCSNEDTPGSLSTFSYDKNGALTPKAVVRNTTGGDVSSQIYGSNGSSFIALAHYGHSSISTYRLPVTNTSQPLQDLALPFPGPGPVSSRQDKGYPHQVIADPSGRWLFSPDLGADLVRVFAIDGQSGILTQRAEIKMTPGTGPRHAAFYATSTATYVYIAAELSNKLSGYRMDIDKSTGTPSFTQVVAPMYAVPTATNNSAIFLAEARVVGTTLTVSNRGDQSFGSGMDSLTVYQIGSDGRLSNARLFPTGGNWPRSFDISKDGSMVAVGNQKSKTVVVKKRDVRTGDIGAVVGTVTLKGEVIDVIWA